MRITRNRSKVPVKREELRLLALEIPQFAYAFVLSEICLHIMFIIILIIIINTKCKGYQINIDFTGKMIELYAL